MDSRVVGRKSQEILSAANIEGQKYKWYNTKILELYQEMYVQ